MLENSNHEMSEILNRLHKEYLGKVDSSEYPYSYKAIIGYSLSANAIKDGIFKALEYENVYSSKILFRSLIEHYIKFLYIVYRHATEKKDDVGKDFLVYYQADELVKYGNALQFSLKLDGKYKGIDPMDAVKKFSDEAYKKSKKELEEISKQFQYREILRFFEKNNSDLFNSQKAIFLPMITSFAELSSFVHGGPFTNELHADGISDNEAMDLYSNSFIMSGNILFFTLMALSETYKNLNNDRLKIDSLVRLHMQERGWT